MAYKQAVFANGEIYHVFNRGVEKRVIFSNKRDYLRFIETADYYRFKNPPRRFSFRLRNPLNSGARNSSPLVEIVCFCLMPNHFHLLLKQLDGSGVSKFINQLSNSYTKYFNTKNKRIGPLFQGTFKAVRMENEEQMVHVSRYIHLNPVIDYLVKNLNDYEYSSYPEFIGSKMGFCKTQPVLNNFSSPKAYQKFVSDQEEYARSIKKIERLIFDNK